MPRIQNTLHTEILNLLRESGRGITAYEVLDSLRPLRPKIAPPTVYRALKSLIEQGDVHRLESMNAFVACQKRCAHQTAILTICKDCGGVQERKLPAAVDTLLEAVSRSGFAPERHIVEVHGVCIQCTSNSELAG